MRMLTAFLTFFLPFPGYASITETDFNTTFDNVVSIYKPLVEAQGAVMDARRKFTYPEPVGDARREADHWIVELWGGYATPAEMTTDSEALVVCHEFGHQFGGAPFRLGTSDPWAAAEGQADYFAANICFPEYLKRFVAPVAEANPLPAAVKKCVGQTDVYCTRKLRAAFEFAELIAAVQKNPAPSFDTFDSTVVTKTNIDHPEAQCRFDTFLAGFANAPRPACWYNETN